MTDTATATVPSIATHNGKFTVTNLKTGNHRTYQIKTVTGKDKPLYGKRIVSMLTGPDNGNDYKGFAFLRVADNGKVYVNVWKKFQGGAFDGHAKLLENLETLLDQGTVDVQAATKCRICNLDLTDPDSIASGIGPICKKNQEGGF